MHTGSVLLVSAAFVAFVTFVSVAMDVAVDQTSCPHQSHRLAASAKSSDLTLRTPSFSEGYVVVHFAETTVATAAAPAVITAACTIAASGTTTTTATSASFPKLG